MAQTAQVVVFGLMLAFLVRYLWTSSRPQSLDEVLESIGAPEELSNHTDYFAKREVIKVDDGVYVAVNYAVANSIMLVGRHGVVIVDTTESQEAAQEILAEFRNITDKPIKAIIFTHHHTDHVMGAEVFIEDPDDPPPTYAHGLFEDQQKYTFKKNMALYNRARYQFGMDITKGFVNSGIGNRLRFTMSKPPASPTHTVNKDIDVSIAGINMRLIHIPGETADQMGVWLPDQRILLSGDDIYKSFPNLYAIRGTAPRDVSEWIRSLDKMRKLRPRCIVGSHAQPVCGQQEVYDLLSNYMYGVQFVHDQTVRYINKGMHPDEIAKRVKLPAELGNHPYLQQFYGTVPWSVKGVYISYLGWFSGYAEDLNPLTPSDRSEHMVELVGVNGLLKAARSALAKDDDQWALELATHVYYHDPTNGAALGVRQEAMAKLAAGQMSANGRNFYMSAMMADAGQLKYAKIVGNAVYVKIDVIMSNLPLRLKAEDVPEGEHLVGCFHFTDSNRTFCGTIHKGVMEMEEVRLEQFDFLFSSTEQVFKEIVAQTRSPVTSYVSGNVRVEGGMLKLRRFMNYLDRD